ncbi:MAG TPA: TonB-dependent receptor [Opitutaceae bacterium]|nr:TonB-dependent receptor [Opitutaceae bacterium]
MRTRTLPIPVTPGGLLLAIGLFLSWLTPAFAQSAATGTVIGTVNNSDTGMFLKDVLVEIPELNRQALTDGSGAYRLFDVPVGTHTVKASYIGLDVATQTVTVTAGERATLNFNMGTQIYKLAQFTVTGEREGNAASITRQRNAPNVKNVLALDALGNLPNDSAGELLIRLPGVAGAFDDEGNVTGVSVRGTDAGLNTVSVDGNIQASAGGFNRDFRTHNISGALFEEIEVIKAPTPDMPGDSLGGAVNLKTRSPLTMKEKRRIDYGASVRYAAPFFDHTPLRTAHRAHPMLSVGYQEVFDVFGEERNLAVSLKAFYSENVNSVDQTLLDYQSNSLSGPAYVWDYRRQNAYNNRLQRSLNLKVEYKLSDRSRFYLGAIWNDAPEKFNRLYTVRAYTGAQSVATIGANGQPTGNNPILPGWTQNRTEVRAVPNSIFELNSTLYSFLDNQRQINAGGVHDFDRLKIDYDAAYSHSKPLLQSSYRGGNAGGGIFTMDTRSVGWVLDKTQSAVEPSFNTTGAVDIHDPAAYSNAQLTNRDNKRFTTYTNASANATYVLPTSFAASVKTGFRFRGGTFKEERNQQQFRYVGNNLASLVDRSLSLTYFEDFGGFLPFIDSSSAAQDIRNNPQAWNEDRYYNRSQWYMGTRGADEEVTAGYVQASTRLGNLNLLAGVRVERTDVNTWGYVRSRVLSTTAERAADPIGSANRDYNNYSELDAGYTDWFPGIHAVYKITPNLQGRASWSNSIGRPSISNLLPSLSFSDAAQTVTISNPGLIPQYAENFDVGLEYYFEPVGQVSVGWFRKDIEDFITNVTGGIVGSGPDNGFNGDYAGYEIRTTANGGRAKIDGWEFNYQQQFTFLPGFWRGFSFNANYTKLNINGDYGEIGPRTTTADVQRFIPETINLRLAYSYRKIGFNVLYNYQSDYLQDYNATDASRLRYKMARELINVGVSYRITRNATLSLDVANIFNEPQQFYRGVSDRLERSTTNGVAIVAGVRGRF